MLHSQYIAGSGRDVAGAEHQHGRITTKTEEPLISSCLHPTMPGMETEHHLASYFDGSAVTTSFLSAFQLVP